MGDTDSPEYPKLPRNSIKRYKDRGTYDYQTIHSIVNTAPVIHVSFKTPDEEDPFPAVLPMLGFMGSFSNQDAPASEPLDLYIHGYISSRLFRLGKTPPPAEEEGLPLTIAATHMDGLVLSLTPNHNSYNYRSAILHGYATVVEEPEEKMWAMVKITNNVIGERWENSRVPPTKTEMTSTQILKVRVVDASAKIRAGEPGEDRADLKNEEIRKTTWVGVIPTYLTYGEPIPSGENRVAKVPSYISSFVKEENEVGKKLAIDAVTSKK
ncbi:flavin-nucleotide-binding protein [Tricladium varicosporioides]|nr:flavin-nucleotide-binding protein [Hymenoscyphus varicosporioides]